MLLQTLYPTYNPQGLEILGAIFEDNSGNPATLSFAKGYASGYGWTFPAIVDNTFQLGAYFDKAAAPMNMYVDLTTMEILAIELGFNSEMETDIQFYLSQIER